MKKYEASPGLIRICQSFVDTFGDVSSFKTVEEWVAGFFVDEDASHELVLWMCMRNVYRNQTVALDEKQKKRFFGELVTASMGLPGSVVIGNLIQNETEACLNELSEYTVTDGKIILFT